jgi:hypothetical protein
MALQIRLEALRLAVGFAKTPTAAVKTAERFKQYIEQGIVNPPRTKRGKTPDTGDDDGTDAEE